MKKQIASILALSCVALLGITTSASALTRVSANTEINTDTTWCDGTNTGPIILEGVVFVNGGATLTILPGCVIRGDGRTGPSAGGPTTAPGALVITRDGTLIADGTADSPIIFTTAAMDGSSGAGAANGVPDRDGSSPPRILPYVDSEPFYDASPATAPLAPLDANGDGNHLLWGGLVILGSAPTNLADDCDARTAAAGDIAYGECFVEGLNIPGFALANAVYGGNEPHDYSGIIRHVSVRHAGDEIGNSNELNGITLAGVGDGTVFENVEVYNNFDDGIEWFGGTVNGKNLVVSFAMDDQIDMDQGYTGVNQNVFILMNWFDSPTWDAGLPVSNNGDKMAELDGVDHGAGNGFNVNVRIATIDRAPCGAECDDSDEAPWPFPNASIWNLTGLGSQIPAARQTASGVSATSINDGLQMRHGFGGTLANSIVVFTGAEENVDLASGGEGATAGFDTSDNVANDLIRVVASSFEGTLAGDDQLALDNGDDAVDAGEYGLVSATISDHYNVTGATVASLIVDADSCVGFAPGGTGTPGVLALGGAGCDPRNATSDPGVIPQDSGLDRSATYRGAFEAGAPLWVDTWTALAQGGLF